MSLQKQVKQSIKASRKISIISDVSETDKLRFTLFANISIANGLRRTMITHIPVIAMRGFPNSECNIDIKINRTYLNNEIIKHRLSCVPVYIKPDQSYDTLKIELHVHNTTNKPIYATTEHIHIFDTKTKKYLDKSVTQKIFPKDPYTGMFIDLVCLQPNIINLKQGEEIKLSATLSKVTAEDDSVFNVTSTCSYGYTPDSKSINEAIKTVENKEEWRIQNIERYYIKNSFNFVIESASIYKNKEIVSLGCDILCEKILKCIEKLAENSESITEALHIADNCFIIYLKDDDQTVGRILEHGIFNKFFPNEIHFCGYQKIHPMYKNSTIQLIGKTKLSRSIIIDMINTAGEMCIETVQSIRNKI